MNKLRENKADKESRAGGSKFFAAVARVLAGILGGSILTRDGFVKSLPFVFYLAGLAMLYIANSYYSEKTIVKSYQLRKELKELRYEFVSNRSALMYESKQSQVAKRLEAAGIEESRVPPVKIRVKSDEQEHE